MRGQGYDGARNMGGKYRGVQARVKELYPLAMYTHCCNHVLNLVISTYRSCQLLEMRWQLYRTYAFLCRVLHSVYRYFKTMLKKKLQARLLSRQKLKPICATRWVERHDSIIIFVTLLPAVVSTLEELQQQHTSGIILPVSKLLQKKELDICSDCAH